MKTVSCNLCGQDRAELLHAGPDLLLNRPEPRYQLVQCTHCGLIYQNPQLELGDFQDHYPDEYICYPKERAAGDPLTVRLDRWHGLIRRCRRIEKHHPPPGRLLDIGCSTGQFMAAMERRGWEVTGVELNAGAADYARRHYGLQVFTGTLEEAAFEGGSFDLINLWGVLEHVPDPKGTLMECHRLLRVGSTLVLGLPNPTAFEARVFKASWVGWDQPRHLQLFTPQVLREYLRATGYRFLKQESFSGRLRLTLISLEFERKLRGLPEARWQPWLNFLDNWPLRILTWPLYRTLELVNKATNMAVFAQKA